MARVLTTAFNETDCIGDCYEPINNSLANLDTAVQDLSSYDSTLKSAITPSGSNLIVTGNLRADTIQNTSGQNLFVNGYPRQPGQIIERLSGLCDGSQITVGSGTYTMPNVTAIQDIGSTRVDVTGSLINYTPPTGTTRVVYEYEPIFSFLNGDPIGHFSLSINGTEVVWSRASYRLTGTNPAARIKYTWIIRIGGTDDTANSGRQSTWTTSKELKLRARSYDNTNYRFKLHSLVWWDGVGVTTLQPPFLTITSIA